MYFCKLDILYYKNIISLFRNIIFNENEEEAKVEVEEDIEEEGNNTEEEINNTEKETNDTEEEEAIEEESEVEEEEENINREIGNDHDDIEHGDERLYFGAALNVSQSILLILTLAFRHNLNMSCLADIINVINLHCPPQGLKKNSIFKFKKLFSLKKINFKKNYYYDTCERELKDVNDMCPLCTKPKNSYFIKILISYFIFKCLLSNI